jgi:DNA-directed RNA polymerase N-terminal
MKHREMSLLEDATALGYEQRATEWLNSMEKDFKIMPDIHTYAIFIFHYLHSSQIVKAREIVDKIEAKGLKLSTLLVNTQLLDSEEKQMLMAFLADLGKLENINHSTTDSLLISAFEDLKNVAPKQAPKVDTFSPEEVKEMEELRKIELTSSSAGGVSILRKTLDKMRQLSSMEKYSQQLWLEHRSYDAAFEQYEQTQAKMPEEVRKNQLIHKDILIKWHDDLVTAIEKTIKDADLNKGEPDALLPFLKLLTPAQLSKIVISEFMRVPARIKEKDYDSLVSTGAKGEFGKVTALQITLAIGKSIEREVNLHQMSRQENRKEVSYSNSVQHQRGDSPVAREWKIVQYYAAKSACRIFKEGGKEVDGLETILGNHNTHQDWLAFIPHIPKHCSDFSPQT